MADFENLPFFLPNSLIYKTVSPILTQFKWSIPPENGNKALPSPQKKKQCLT